MDRFPRQVSHSDPFISPQTPSFQNPQLQPMYDPVPYGMTMSAQYVTGGTSAIAQDPYGYSRPSHRRPRRHTYGSAHSPTYF